MRAKAEHVGFLLQSLWSNIFFHNHVVHQVVNLSASCPVDDSALYTTLKCLAAG